MNDGRLQNSHMLLKAVQPAPFSVILSSYDGAIWPETLAHARHFLRQL